MFDTPHLKLPLLASAQAQKHVTMNEALVRLDALSAPSARSADIAAPPPTSEGGETWIIPTSASGEWLGRGGQLAFRVNGGWSFADPKPGWRVWVADRAEAMVYAGSAWVADPIGPVGLGAQTSGGLLIADEIVVPGSGFDAALTIPDRALVIGVTGRVMSQITGTGLSGWRLGVAESNSRYGSSIGLTAGSSVVGITSTPVGYYVDTSLRIEPEGGAFAAGAIRIAIHYLTLTPPSSV
ncbi:MAG: DUF2793 domain-containing protein [Paracoccaceae bacterium]